MENSTWMISSKIWGNQHVGFFISKWRFLKAVNIVSAIKALIDIQDGVEDILNSELDDREKLLAILRKVRKAREDMSTEMTVVQHISL